MYYLHKYHVVVSILLRLQVCTRHASQRGGGRENTRRCTNVSVPNQIKAMYTHGETEAVVSWDMVEAITSSNPIW
jgi:hypothetical protein